MPVNPVTGHFGLEGAVTQTVAVSCGPVVGQIRAAQRLVPGSERGQGSGCGTAPLLVMFPLVAGLLLVFTGPAGSRWLRPVADAWRTGRGWVFAGRWLAGRRSIGPVAGPGIGEGVFDSVVSGLVVAGDAVGVGVEQDTDAVAGAGGDLGWDAPAASHSDRAAWRRS